MQHTLCQAYLRYVHFGMSVTNVVKYDFEIKLGDRIPIASSYVTLYAVS